jgi:hypothetical protein
MISFKHYLNESQRQLQWDANPKIGWWKDQKVLRLYHGTDMDHLDSIYKSGLDRLDRSTGMISFAFEPFTARAFSVMGGEARFLGAGARAKTVPQTRRVVLVFDIPQKWIVSYEDPQLRGNDPVHKERLVDKTIYENFDQSDQQYYQLCELRVSSVVPAKYLIGYMVK